MKKIIFSTTLALSLALAACGNGSDNPIEKDETSPDNNSSSQIEDNNDNNENEAGEVGEVTESELGKLTVLYKDKELEVDASNGPVNATLHKIQVAKLETNEESKDMFDGLEVATIITVEASSENTVDETTNYYLDQATLVTDTGQQVDADLLLSDVVGGAFLGKVKKEGNIIWVLKHDEDINHVTLHIRGASNNDPEKLGEDLKIEIPLNKS